MLKTISVLAVVSISTAEESKPACDYLKIVRDYADAMVYNGRDVYGKVRSPLFAEALDRNTMRMLENDALDKVVSIPREQWGIRSHDRMIAGANPQHCQKHCRSISRFP